MSGLPKLNEILSDIKGFLNKELEKQADDDAISLVDSWVLDHCGKYESVKNATDDLIPRIQQYAESYHAKKCAECQKAKESL